jgi:hypothetical protein
VIPIYSPVGLGALESVLNSSTPLGVSGITVATLIKPARASKTSSSIC